MKEGWRRVGKEGIRGKLMKDRSVIFLRYRPFDPADVLAIWRDLRKDKGINKLPSEAERDAA